MSRAPKRRFPMLLSLLVLLCAGGLLAAWLGLVGPFSTKSPGDVTHSYPDHTPGVPRLEGRRTRRAPERATAGSRHPAGTTNEPSRTPPGGRGSVRVVVQDAKGRQVEDGGSVYLFWREPGSEDPWDRDGVPSALSPGGIARLGDVPLGRELLLSAAGGERYFHGDAVVLGPMRPGEEVTAEVRLGALRAVVTGTLVDESGVIVPKWGVSMGVMCVDEGTGIEDWRRRRRQDADPSTHCGGLSSVSMRNSLNDERGRFRAYVRVPPMKGKRRVLLIESKKRAEDGRVVIRRNWVLLDENLPGGVETDLGTIVLQPEEGMEPERVIASGRIVDENDRPVRRMTITVSIVDPNPKSYGWGHMPNTRVKTRPDGFFRVLTTAEPPESFRITACADRRVRAAAHVRSGAQDVLLRMMPGARLHAWFTAPEGVPIHRLVGYIQREGGRAGAPNQALGSFAYDHPPRRALRRIRQDQEYELGGRARLGRDRSRGRRSRRCAHPGHRPFRTRPGPDAARRAAGR